MRNIKSDTELQNDLADAFTTNGIVGEALTPVLDSERAFGTVASRKLKGHEILSHAWQEFYILTMQIASSYWTADKPVLCPPTYSETWILLLGCFRSIRAVDILYHNGYPLEGLTRLRHLKEQAVMLAGMARGEVTYNDVIGIPPELQGKHPFTDQDFIRIHRHKRETQERLLGETFRKESGLAQDQREILRSWEGMFNQEIHGGLLTLVLDHGPAIKGDDTTSLAPTYQEKSCAMFINRFCEICWMLHCVLPILQISTQPFGEEWREKWKLLDKNFFIMERSLQDVGKPIGAAIIEVIKQKFAFSTHLSFDLHVKVPPWRKPA